MMSTLNLTIRSQCGSCKGIFNISAEYAERVAACPRCKQQFKVVPCSANVPAQAKTPAVPKEQMMVYETMARPMQIAIATFWGGPLAGGGLLAWNYQKLGKQTAAIWSLVVSGIMFVLNLGLALVIMSFMESSSDVPPFAWKFLIFCLHAGVIGIFALYASETWKAIWKLESLPPINFKKSGRPVLISIGVGLLVSVIIYGTLMGAMIMTFIH